MNGQIYFLLYNKGNGWELYSSHPDNKEYLEEFVNSMKTFHASWKFKIVCDIENFRQI